MDYAPVTVCVPTIPEHADLLERALVSVRAQTLPPHETIIECDNDHRGAAWTRNRLLAKVDTPWLAWLDDDDELLPNHLQVLMAAAEAHPEADLVYPCMEVAGTLPDGQPARNPLAVAHQGRWVNPCGVPFGDEQRHHLTYAGNFIPVTYLLRTSLARQIGGMPDSQGPGREEDYAFLLALLRAGARIIHVPHVTWRYHFHDRNTGGGWQGTGASNTEAFR